MNKEKVCKIFYRRIRAILEYMRMQKVIAVNTLLILVVIYSFIIKKKNSMLAGIKRWMPKLEN